MSSAASTSATSTTTTSPWMSILALMGSVASMCLDNSFAKTLFPVLGATGTVIYHVTVGTVILLALWRSWRLHLSRADASRIALYGATLASMNLLFCLSLQRLPIGIAIAVEFTELLALAVLLSCHALDFVWIGLAVVGLLMLTVTDESIRQVDHLDTVYTFAAGMCWALYIVTGKNLGGLHAGQATSLGMVAGALLAILLGVAQTGSALLAPLLILAGLGIGLLSSAIPYSLEMAVLKHLSSKTFPVLLSLKPAIRALAGAIVLHEQLTGRQWVAILTIIATSAGCALTVRAPKPSPDPADVA